MGGFNLFIIATLGLAICITMFYGFINLAKKSFNNSNKPTIDSSEMIHDQQIYMQDLERKQKDMKRQQDQKMKDLQRQQRNPR